MFQRLSFQDREYPVAEQDCSQADDQAAYDVDGPVDSQIDAAEGNEDDEQEAEDDGSRTRKSASGRAIEGACRGARSAVSSSDADISPRQSERSATSAVIRGCGDHFISTDASCRR